MDFEQIDRIELKQLDVSSTDKEGRERVEEDLNSFVKKFEDGGLQVIGEDVMPQMNNIRAIANIYFEKRKNVVPTRYRYLVLDSRNGHNIVGRLLNEEVLKLKKDGNKIVRKLFIPMRNDAFVQLLLVYVPSEKPKEGILKDVEKAIAKQAEVINKKDATNKVVEEYVKEVKEDEEKSSEALSV